MSAPCGISKFKDKYHVFYLYNPDAPRWGYMHWGHCVTADFIEYEELPVAVFPFDGGSLGGGSSVVKDGRLYLFYSYDNEVLSVVSEDGIHFADTEFDTVTGDYDYFTEN